MAHEISNIDSHEGVEQAWHKLTTVKTAAQLADFTESKANWTVNKTPLTFGSVPTVAPDRFNLWTNAGDEEIYLTTVSNVYSVLQNSQLFEFMNNTLRGVKFEVVSILTIKRRTQFFITVKLQDVKTKNGDAFGEYLTFGTSHDGSMRVCAYSTFIRAVCANTVRAGKQSKGIIDLEAPHTPNGLMKMDTWERQFDELLNFNRSWFSAYSSLEDEGVTQETASQFLTGFLSPNGKPLAKKSENQRETLVSLFNRGKGNRGETKADLLNSITEFYTHGLGYDSKTIAKDPWKIVESSEGGKGAEAKSRAFDLLTNRKVFAETVQAGQNSLLLAATN